MSCDPVLRPGCTESASSVRLARPNPPLSSRCRGRSRVLLCCVVQDVSACLDLWTFLCQLLQNPAAAERATDAAASLELLSATWRKLHMAAMEQPTLTAASVTLQDCRVLLAGLRAVRRTAAVAVLEPCRAAYPRLWLVGDEALLQAIAVGAEVEALPGQLLERLFGGMAGLELAWVPQADPEAEVGWDGVGLQDGKGWGLGGRQAGARCPVERRGKGGRRRGREQARHVVVACAAGPPACPVARFCPAAASSCLLPPVIKRTILAWRPQDAPPPQLEVSAIVGRHGEVCALKAPLPVPANAPLRLEAWLPQLEAELRRSLLAHTRDCVAACGQMHPDQWVSSFPSQCVMLVDAVVWTQSVAASLGRAAQGERAVMRTLLDQSVLRLEGIARQLRTALAGLPAGAMVTTAVRQADDARSWREGELHAAAAVAAATSGLSGQHAASMLWPPLALAQPPSSTDASGRASPGDGPATTAFSRSRRTAVVIDAATGRSPEEASRLLTRQAVRGLERLIAAGICHRQVVEDLIAADTTSPQAFDWERHVRHYWDAERGVVEVAVVQQQHEYGFEYDGTEQDCAALVAPLAVPSLLAAIGALHASPVVTLAHGV